LIRAQGLAADVVALNSGYPKLKQLIKAASDLATYIANNAAAIVNYCERWHNGERISTAFVESTVNRVVSRRFAKKQQMQWSKVGAHRLLQTRTKTLDGTLRDLFTRWYPGIRVNDISDFVARYNAAWRLERLGYLSPLDYRARHRQPESHAA
jgi:hypothetical protein